MGPPPRFRQPDDNAASRASALRYRALVEGSRDLFLTVAADLTITWTSPSVETVLGYQPGDLVGDKLSDLLAPASWPALEEFLANRKQHMVRETVELELRTQTRRTRLVEATVSDVPKAERALTGDCYVLCCTDVTEWRQLERSLRRQSLYDPLTGLATRTTLHFELQQRLQRLTRRDYLGLLHLDVRDFRSINESIGFERGDALLAEVATRLRASLQPGDVLARLGGDEFALAVVEPSPKNIVDRSRVVAALFDEPFDLDGRPQRLSTVIGLTLTGDRRAVAGDLLDQAALALGAAKGNPLEPIRVYEGMMRVTATERFELGADLVGAVSRSELRLVYQPIVDIRRGRPHGAEALVRWIHPERGPISPAVFIPLAEKSGIIVELGRWVMGEACRQMRSWHDHVVGADELAISVNVSARQLELPGEAERLATIVESSGLEPRWVTVELTESMFLDDPGWIHDQLQLFRDAGMHVAVDDFGTGAAGLAHLRDTPFNTLKIDKTYIDALRRTEESRLLVQGVIELAHTLGAETVAEGVEDAEELEVLAALGCDHIQGFHLGRPMEPTQFEEWLAERLAGADS